MKLRDATSSWRYVVTGSSNRDFFFFFKVIFFALLVSASGSKKVRGSQYHKMNLKYHASLEVRLTVVG